MESQPLEEQIKIYYSDEFNAVSGNISIIEDFLQIKLSLSETLDIVMFICSAVERLLHSKSQLNVLIVTPGNLAAGNLLAAQIQKRFNFNICGIVDRSFLSEQLLSQIDFVVSTEHIETRGKINAVVRPILDEKECNHILKITDAIEKDRGDEGQILVSSQLYLPINSEHIQIDTHANSWQEAIRLGGKLLVDNGDVTETYVQALIQTIEDNGPYFVIAPGLALAHAAPKFGIIKPAISLVLFQKEFPLVWRNLTQFTCFSVPQNGRSIVILISSIN